MTRAVLSLGANLGDPLSALRFAVDMLTERVTIAGVSPVYVTAPVGGVEQDDFHNAVLLVDTDLTAPDLLTLVHEVERAAGRTRNECDVRWGPRALDVDVIAYGETESDDPDLTLPHPRAHERAFVLRPWLDVDPDATLPGHGRVDELVGSAQGDVRRTDEPLRV